MVDEEGFLHFRGRLKEMIKTGGINVSPAEVEAVLTEVPEVELAYVIGLPDPERDQRVAAVIVPRDGAQPTADALTAHCSAHLAAYKVPREYRFVSAGARCPSPPPASSKKPASSSSSIRTRRSVGGAARQGGDRRHWRQQVRPPPAREPARARRPGVQGGARGRWPRAERHRRPLHPHRLAARRRLRPGRPGLRPRDRLRQPGLDPRPLRHRQPADGGDGGGHRHGEGRRLRERAELHPRARHPGRAARLRGLPRDRRHPRGDAALRPHRTGGRRRARHAALHGALRHDRRRARGGAGGAPRPRAPQPGWP